MPQISHKVRPLKVDHYLPDVCLFAKDDIPVFNMYFFMNVGLIGCGKTTVSETLNNLFPKWKVIPNNDVVINTPIKTSLKFFKKKETRLLSSLIEDHTYQYAIECFEAGLSNLPSSQSRIPFKESLCSAIIADSTFFLLSIRKNFISEISTLSTVYNANVIANLYPNENKIAQNPKILGKKGPRVLPNQLIGQEFLICPVFIAFEYRSIHEQSLYNREYQHPDLDGGSWKVTTGRVLAREDHHPYFPAKTPKEITKTLDDMKKCSRRFQPIFVKKKPDTYLTHVISLNSSTTDSSRTNVDKILAALSSFQDLNIPNIPEAEIDQAFEKALNTKPFNSVYNEKRNPPNPDETKSLLAQKEKYISTPENLRKILQEFDKSRQKNQ